MQNLTCLEEEFYNPNNWHLKSNSPLSVQFNQNIMIENTSNKPCYFLFKEYTKFFRSSELIKTIFFKHFDVCYQGYSNQKNSCKLCLLEYKNKQKMKINSFNLNQPAYIQLDESTSSIRVALRLEPEEMMVITKLSLKQKQYKKLAPYLISSHKPIRNKPISKIWHDFFKESSWQAECPKTTKLMVREEIILSYQKDDILSFLSPASCKETLPRLTVTSYDKYELIFKGENLTKGGTISLQIEEYQDQSLLSAKTFELNRHKSFCFHENCNQIHLALKVSGQGLSLIKNLKLISPLRHRLEGWPVTPRPKAFGDHLSWP